ncbi:MAG: tetratricopeptide repeat protein [Chloroflexi bacterium]|nr:tetratricopeptide repeat protein [Chloroflexota bacterium]MBU1750316.1 tetratricopeptide repeat protein [Chloroflexota bacterium]
MTEIAKLEQAIAALESQRAILGDAVVDASIAALHEKLVTLRASAPAWEHGRGEQQRKLVTILFADIASSTEMSAHLDPEDALAIMGGALEQFETVIEQHEGAVVRFLGDGLLAIFGFHAAREDDAERAVRAGLGILETAQQYAQQVEDRWGLAGFGVRVGLNTGLVLLGEVGAAHEITAMGDAVNLAARMEQNAPVGGLLISHDTYRHVRGLFDVRPLEPLAVKGKAEPVQAYLVVRAKPRAFRLMTRGVEGVETRMIGRAAEMAHLQNALHTTIATGRLRVVTIVSEAGLGKSRLLYEFQNWLDLQPENLRLFRGRASQEMQRLPYALLRDVFSFRFRMADSDPLAVARDKLVHGIAGFMGEDPEVEMKAHFIGHLIGLDLSASPHLSGILDNTQQIRDRALHYLAQFFTAVARERSEAAVVLLLEDLHWADDDSLDALVYLLSACDRIPLLLVVAARPPLFDRRPTWAQGLDAYTRLDLAPLSKDDSRALVEEILKKASEVPQALRELVVSGAEGNPFYAEELIKILIDEQVIIPGEDLWRVMPDRLIQVRVPPTLTGVLQARLDSLPPIEYETLQRASVVGRVFWNQAVAFLGSTSPEHPVQSLTSAMIDAAVHALHRRELVFQRETSAFAGTDEYIFKHTMLRDVTYETVLKKQRRVYHAQTAQWLVEHSGERADQYAALIAEHYEQAGEIASAAAWYGRAGAQAQAAYAPDAAIGYYRKAFDFTAQLGGTPALAWYTGLGTALRARARYAEAVDVYTSLYQAAGAVGDTVMQARAWNETAGVQNIQGNPHAALESAERAEALARIAVSKRDTDAAQLAWAAALLWKGWTLYRMGDASGALTWGEQGLAHCEKLGPRSEWARGLNLLGMAHLVLGHFEQAIQYAERTLAAYRELGDRLGEGAILNNLGAIAYFRGEYATALTRYQEALDIARETGSRLGEVVGLSNLGGARVGLGDYAAAEQDLRQVIATAGVAGASFLSETYRFLAEACLGQGKVTEALDAAQQALAHGQEAGNKELIGGAWRVLGQVRGRQSEGADVDSETGPAGCFRESLRMFTEMGAEAERARTLREWGRYEIESGDREGEGGREKGREMWEEARGIFERLELHAEVERMNRQRASLPA